MENDQTSESGGKEDALPLPTGCIWLNAKPSIPCIIMLSNVKENYIKTQDKEGEGTVSFVLPRYHGDTSYS